MSKTTPPYPWQNTYWHQFAGQVTQGHLPHAILLLGVAGIGTESLARAMAEFLMCSSPVEQAACGQCKACRLLQSHNHPDLFLLSPEEKSVVIKVDQVRQLTEFVAKTSQQGGRKLVIIEPAEAMNIAAGNALLKCLEEPSGDTVFILVCHHANRLLPTIRSRCACHTLPVPERALAVSWLETMGVESAALLLDETHGAPLTAHQWSRDDVIASQDKACELLVAALQAQKPVTTVAGTLAGECSGLELAELLINWLEQLIRERTRGSRRSLLAHWEPLVGVAQALSTVELFKLREVYCQRKAQLLANPNLNANMVIEDLLLEWQRYALQAARQGKLVAQV